VIFYSVKSISDVRAFQCLTDYLQIRKIDANGKLNITEVNHNAIFPLKLWLGMKEEFIE